MLMLDGAERYAVQRTGSLPASRCRHDFRPVSKGGGEFSLSAGLSGQSAGDFIEQLVRDDDQPGVGRTRRPRCRDRHLATEVETSSVLFQLQLILICNFAIILARRNDAGWQ